MRIRDLFKGRSNDDEAIALLMARAKESVAKGDFLSALDAYIRMLELRPNFAEGHYRRGNALKEMGRLQEALADYDCAVALNPDYAYAWCNRGAVLERMGRFTDALISQERAIAIDPKDHVSHYNRGSVLAALGRIEESIVAFDAAIALKDNYFEPLLNRGNSLAALHRDDAAMASYDEALRINPAAAEAHLGRGGILLRRRHLEGAMQAYEAAIHVRNDYGAAYHNRGNVYMELRQFDRAFADFDRRIELEPDSAISHEARGDAAINLRRYRDAIANYDRALALDPDSRNLPGRLRHFKMHFCDWGGLDEDLTSLRRAIEAGKPVCLPFHALTLFDDASLHRRTAEIWAAQECSSDFDLGPIPLRAADDRIRLAYFSADFRNHPVSILAAQIFELHDRSRFETCAFAFGPMTEDSMTLRLRGIFDRFIDIRGLDDKAVVQMCRDMRIDIAIDLGGYTEYARSKIFAMRAAPIQVSFLGYPGTTGVSFIDYLVCDAMVIPEPQAAQYSETQILLPHSYLPHDSTRTTGDRVWTKIECGLPATGFVFCGFHSSYKILPATFDIWMRIMSAVQHAVLWLADAGPDARANLRREAEHRGVDPARLVFAPRIASNVDHLARQRLADLFLDTLPYNAHTTALDALWTGLPVVTLAGKAFAGRVGASVLKAVGMAELIAESPADYEEIAIHLAENPAATISLKEKLARSAHSSPLFDSRRYVRDLEAAYAEIYRRHNEGLPPTNIKI